MYYILEYILPHMYMYNTIYSRIYIGTSLNSVFIPIHYIYIHIHTHTIHYTVGWQIPYKMN